MLNSDYKEMLLILIKNKVDFMIVGAYALAYFGFPRSTGDIDIFVDATVENSQKIHKSLIEFGAPVSGLDLKYFSNKGNFFQIGVAPCRIDILNDIDGLDFSKTNYDIAIIDDIELKIISKNDFIINKKASGRHKDLADVDCLENNN